MKKQIVKYLREQISTKLENAKEAYQSGHEHATEPELVAESKYDTRGVEAGYLAGAQKKRVEELKQELELLDEMVLDHSTESVSVGSLVELRFNDQTRLYFISSTSGGSMIEIEGSVVLVVSAFSPIGSEVIGLQEGDTFELETKSSESERIYEVGKIV